MSDAYKCYEYQYIQALDVGRKDIENMLNDLGADRWRVVSSHVQGGTVYFILMREKYPTHL